MIACKITIALQVTGSHLCNLSVQSCSSECNIPYASVIKHIIILKYKEDKQNWVFGLVFGWNGFLQESKLVLVSVKWEQNPGDCTIWVFAQLQLIVRSTRDSLVFAKYCTIATIVRPNRKGNGIDDLFWSPRCLNQCTITSDYKIAQIS